MIPALPGALGASVSTIALQSSGGVEPRMIAVYLLLLAVPWVVWEGMRSRGAGPTADEGDGSGDEPPRGGGAEERRAGQGRAGHVDGIS